MAKDKPVEDEVVEVSAPEPQAPVNDAPYSFSLDDPNVDKFDNLTYEEQQKLHNA